MATVPSFEEILLEAHQSFGLNSMQSKDKDGFKNFEKLLKKHIDTSKQILDDIFTALDLDEEAKGNFSLNLMNWAGFHKELELHLWTFDAEPRQIVWYMLAYSYIPGLARLAAHWKIDSRATADIQGSMNWYFPQPRTIKDKTMLVLPVSQVMEWLLDLLNLPMDEIKKNLYYKNLDADDIERTLYNWKNKGTLPRIDNIEKYFHEDIKLIFNGIFKLKKTDSLEDQYQSAMDFLTKTKKLDKEGIRDNLPMARIRLDAIFSNTATEAEKKSFIDNVVQRYAQPTLRTIRQQLLLTRASQDAYQRLLKFLCPDVSLTEADPEKNKLLQLVGVYQRVYDLTIEAWNQCRDDGEAAENHWFEEQFHPIEKMTLYSSIMPSLRDHAGSTAILADYLSKIFKKLETNAELEHHIPYSEESRLPITLTHEKRFRDFYIDSDANKKLTTTLKIGNSPWRKLQDVHDFQLLFEVSQKNNFPSNTNEAIEKRLIEIATKPEYTLYIIMGKLHQILNEQKNRNKNTKNEVANLLETAKKNPQFYLWEAVFLRNEAKHHLFCNHFEEAEKLFRHALEACRVRNYGKLRGEIARDAFAVAVSNQRLIPENHEKYYRNLINFLDIKGEVPNMEDTAIEMSQHFWSVLYKPYPSEPRIIPTYLQQVDRKETTEMIFREDWVNFRKWLKLNKHLKDKRLTDVQGHTYLMEIIKVAHNIANTELSSELKARIKNTYKKAIAITIDEFPKLINIADFKAQTPLMMAAHFKDTELVKKLLDAGADTNLQDFHGRTAVHAACASRSFDCALLLLENGEIDIEKTDDGNSNILHTAAKMGHPAIVKKIISLFPELADRKDIHEQTPLDIVNLTLSDIESTKQFWLRNHERIIGSYKEYQEIQSILINR
jgi:hypothetical protein